MLTPGGLGGSLSPGCPATAPLKSRARPRPTSAGSTALRRARPPGRPRPRPLGPAPLGKRGFPSRPEYPNAWTGNASAPSGAANGRLQVDLALEAAKECLARCRGSRLALCVNGVCCRTGSERSRAGVSDVKGSRRRALLKGVRTGFLPARISSVHISGGTLMSAAGSGPVTGDGGSK